MNRIARWRIAAAAAALIMAAAGAGVAVDAIGAGSTQSGSGGLLPTPSGTGSDGQVPTTTGSDPVKDPSLDGSVPTATGSDPVEDPGPTSSRPPLDDPPDPGPVPDDHGIPEADLAAAVASSVRVAAPACRGIVREGSGFAVGDGDLVVTIAHLMVGMDEPVVELIDGRKLAGLLVAFDPANDLAVLRVPGAGLPPLPLSEAAPDGTVGAVLAWEQEGLPDPTPFRVDRPVTVRTEPVGGGDGIERPSWLLAAQTEVGDSGAALVADLDGRITAIGVAWGASRRGGGGVAYATRSGAVQELIASVDIGSPLPVPACD